MLLLPVLCDLAAIPTLAFAFAFALTFALALELASTEVEETVAVTVAVTASAVIAAREIRNAADGSMSIEHPLLLYLLLLSLVKGDHHWQDYYDYDGVSKN